MTACVAHAVAVPVSMVGRSVTRTAGVAGSLEEGLGLSQGVEMEQW